MAKSKMKPNGKRNVEIFHKIDKNYDAPNSKQKEKRFYELYAKLNKTNGNFFGKHNKALADGYKVTKNERKASRNGYRRERIHDTKIARSINTRTPCSRKKVSKRKR